MKKKRRIAYHAALNAAQLEAVRFIEGPLLVIAGAGSGKTRTLTYRVAHLVENNVAPASILLLTFTRKASFEMLRRASLLLDQRCEKVAGGTFHSFANTVLRKYAAKIGFKNGFSILDRVDSENLIGMLKKEMHWGKKYKALPKKQTLNNIFSRAVNKVVPIEDVVLYDYPHFSSHLEFILALENAYRKYKMEHYFFDYDDLLIYLKTLLQEQGEIRDRLSIQYRFLMVDEYQDTNKIQADIIRLLAGTHKNVMVVGDDSQSIYAFRGANFKNIIKFPEIFPGARIIKLEENYRSGQSILDLTNVIIARAAEKYSKTLFSRKKGFSLPVLVRTADENSQSNFVVSKIRELCQSGIPVEQIAVLFRAGFHSFDLEIELGRANMPFIKVGGFKFIESSHIKDVLAHLKVLCNPSDSISWTRVLLLLDRVGPKTADTILKTILARKQSHTSLESPKIAHIKSRHFERLKALFTLIDARPMSVAQTGEAVLNYYMPILKEKHDDYPKRARDLEHLLSIMERYDQIDLFLADMALEPPNTSEGGSLGVGVSNQDRLVLSTIHSAKGLEWHTVFIIWALDGRFPSAHALHRDEDLEEELRLMYVAATRAKENLFFTYPRHAYDRSSRMVFSRPSRFIDHISDEILEKVSLDF